MGHILSALSTMTHLSWTHVAWLSFTELDTTVGLWSDWLVFCDYGFSLSAFWCPLNTYCLTWFLLSWTWGVSLRLLQQSAATAPYLGCGTTDWFQIGKGVHQGCLLPPILFNVYAEYIMRNAGLEEAQTGIKIAGRNVNNLRYADDTTLWQKVMKN